MNRRLGWGPGLLLAVAAAIVAGCSTEPTPPVATDDDLGPQWASERGKIAYLHVSRTLNAPQPTGLYVLDTLTRVSQLALPGIVNGFDWVPGTDTLVVAVGGVISMVASSGAVVPLATASEAFNCDVSPDG